MNGNGVGLNRSGGALRQITRGERLRSKAAPALQDSRACARPSLT
jgi:hypothetical protein